MLNNDNKKEIINLIKYVEYLNKDIFFYEDSNIITIDIELYYIGCDTLIYDKNRNIFKSKYEHRDFVCIYKDICSILRKAKINIILNQ